MNNSCRQLSYRDIALHEHASFNAIIDEKMVEKFADFSKDFNPLHTDKKYALGTEFHGCMAHGMIVGALFSRLIGMYLPEKYSLYLSQTLSFHNPIALGSEVIISGEVIHKTDAHQSIEVSTTAVDAKTKKILVSGEAMVKLLR